MRVRRRVLIDQGRGQFFHVTSRVVDRRFVFGDGEKQAFLGMIRQYEAFCGVQILSYCLMSNHFHLLVHIPRKPDLIPEDEVLRRMKCLYSKERMAIFEDYLSGLTGESADRERKDFFDQFRLRMYDLSHFVRELKLRFSKYFNQRNDRKGTLWEERFKCSLIEGQANALMNTAAYIELNSVRAGIVGDPAKYRWCSYTEALAGGKLARSGIIALATGQNLTMTFSDALKRYKDFFQYKSWSQSGSRKGIEVDDDEQSTIEQGPDSRSLSGGLSVRVRYFLDGLVLGSREFVEDWYHRNIKDLNRGRKRISTPIPTHGPAEIHSYRKVD